MLNWVGQRVCVSVGVADSLPVKSFLSDKAVCINVFYFVFVFVFFLSPLPSIFEYYLILLFLGPCPKNK